jgi:hypothetical protein
MMTSGQGGRPQYQGKQQILMGFLDGSIGRTDLPRTPVNFLRLPHSIIEISTLEG